MSKNFSDSMAEYWVDVCKTEYDSQMEEKLEIARSLDELKKLHTEAKSAAILRLHKEFSKCDNTFRSKYVKQLTSEIKDMFEEQIEAFNFKNEEELLTTKESLEEARKLYHEEMKTRVDARAGFLDGSTLQGFHTSTKNSVTKSIDRKRNLSPDQLEKLEEELDAQLHHYKMKNYLKANNHSRVKTGTGGQLLPAPGPAIGIDLGTTYCCVAAYYNDKVFILGNFEQGDYKTTPSYLSFDKNGAEVFGYPAKDFAHRNPEQTIYDAKRIIGRKFDDPDLQNDIKYWPFTVQDDEGVPKILVNGELLHPEQISGKILKSLKEMAERRLSLPSGSIKKAVITVPAYFNDGQRQATVDAGQLANLEVLTILNEPTAAAIAYSMKRGELERLHENNSSAKKVLVFDLGGGTFDVAVLKMCSDNIEVLGVNGDTHLGGEDFDKKLMEYCASSFKTETGIDLFQDKDHESRQTREKVRARLRRLQTECEKAKKALTFASQIDVLIDAFVDGKELLVKVTKNTFEELNMPYFNRCIEIVKDALKDLQLKPDDIDDVVLVGGSSKIPKVKEMLEELFHGKMLNTAIHPDHAVAYGAAVKAAIMNGEEQAAASSSSSSPKRQPSFFKQTQDVIPMSIGIEIATKELAVILNKNSKIPTLRKEVFSTFRDNQESVQVKIYQGDDLNMASNNSLLGTFDLKGIPRNMAGEETIDIWMEINAMGILHVEAVCRSTKATQSLTVEENKRRMSDSTKDRILGESET